MNGCLIGKSRSSENRCYSGLKLQRYGVTNALMYYLYTTGVAALSHFYFNPLYILPGF
ncbi:hypothetical protein [Neisseria sicca]|uniref:hypothetical protein n=1 Tax=Neisseria sicca TaxID=490 RepID=UPI001649C295|nr:hypothetical protein [Neisseria sicca]